MYENVHVLDDQSLEFWRQLLKLNVAEEIKIVKEKQKILCIGGNFDWVVLSYHNQKNCQRFASLHFETRTEIIPNLDHFFSTTQSVEESFNRFVKKDLTFFQANKSYNVQLLSWLVSLKEFGN